MPGPSTPEGDLVYDFDSMLLRKFQHDNPALTPSQLSEHLSQFKSSARLVGVLRTSEVLPIPLVRSTGSPVPRMTMICGLNPIPKLLGNLRPLTWRLTIH